MQIKIQNGVGCVMCDGCRKVISSNFTQRELAAYKLMQKRNQKMYCLACNPSGFAKQGNEFKTLLAKM